MDWIVKSIWKFSLLQLSSTHANFYACILIIY